MANRTSDLVSRLRERAKGRESGYDGAYMLEAADCIEQLQMPHAEVLKLAELEDGANATALMRALCQKVEAQRREINRLKHRVDTLTEIVANLGPRS